MASTISDIWNNLRQSVLGVKSIASDRTIDNALRTISTYASKTSSNKYIESLKVLTSSMKDGDKREMVDKELFNSVATIEQFDQTGRIRRYREYDSILNRVSYCQRALKCFVDNITSPDDITKRAILTIPLPNNKNDKKSNDATITRCKDIISQIELEKKITKTINGTLKKGDDFIEIIYSDKGQHALTILQENEDLTKTFKVEDFGSVVLEDWKWKDDEETLPVTIKFTLENLNLGIPGTSGSMTLPHKESGYATTYSRIDDVPQSKDKNPVGGDNDPVDVSKFTDKFSETTEDKPNYELKNIFIARHEAQHVVRLETQRFRKCLGFLIFPPYQVIGGAGISNAQTNAIDQVCIRILDKIEKKLQIGNDQLVRNPELRDAIIHHIHGIRTNDDIKVRYVPADYMVHFRLNTDRFSPYGESIFECVNFDCRMLVALKTAMTIKRMTSSTDKRIISVETGLPRDASNLIETIKEGMRKRKISIDGMGSIDTISSQIQTFEDIYLPMKDGKKFIEFEHQQFGPNANEDIEGLKFVRDNIVANLGIPPAFLGLEENVSNRALLTVENINFCRTIISYQKELSIYLKELIAKIYKILFPLSYDDLQHIEITFPEPKISTYEHEMEYVEQVTRLIEALKNLGIPVEYLKKKYLPNYDWDEIENQTSIEKIDKSAGSAPPDDANGMGGGFGMGGY